MPNSSSLPVSEPGRMPDEIAAAIDDLIDEAKYEGGRFSSSDGKDLHSRRDALDAAILSRLGRAEAERDELREKVRILTIQNNARATIIAGHQSMGWDRRAEHLARQQLDSQREANARLTDEVDQLQFKLDAALARAERAEKALAFYADDQNYRLNGPLDPNSSWFEGTTRARAALIHTPDHPTGREALTEEKGE